MTKNTSLPTMGYLVNTAMCVECVLCWREYRIKFRFPDVSVEPIDLA
jgi:hypothetical protein